MTSGPRLLWIVVAAAYCGIELGLFLVASFDSGEDGLAAAAALAPPIACGFIIGRWWATALGLVVVPAALIAGQSGELALAFLVGAALVGNVVALAAGVALSLVWQRLVRAPS